ncbi:MAG TPA: type II toxin-antitoxin system VapC family toxin [Thermoanaerobaculia bacterium]|nr:type II toxin-antitoxin system VapC family toxin [Thermoanaerobaculia bacterium]
MLIDSNIIIYAARPEHQELRRFIAKHTPAVSVVSYVEVLGYHRLTEQDRRYFEDFFIAAPLVQISTDILERATHLRQQRAIGLGDALIGATALVHDLQLLTANTDDFQWISDLRLTNPVAQT